MRKSKTGPISGPFFGLLPVEQASYVFVSGVVLDVSVSSNNGPVGTPFDFLGSHGGDLCVCHTLSIGDCDKMCKARIWTSYWYFA